MSRIFLTFPFPLQIFSFDVLNEDSRFRIGVPAEYKNLCQMPGVASPAG